MQKHVNLVDLVKSFPTNIYLQNLASIQRRTSPIKFAHLAEKSENGSISNVSTKAWTAVSTSKFLALVSILLAISLRPSWIPARSTHQAKNIISDQNDLSSRACQCAQKNPKMSNPEPHIHWIARRHQYSGGGWHVFSTLYYRWGCRKRNDLLETRSCR